MGEEMVALVAAGASRPQKPACSPGPPASPPHSFFPRMRNSSSSQPSYLLCDPRPLQDISVPITVHRTPECQVWLQEGREGEGDEASTSTPSPCQSPVITIRPKERWGQRWPSQCSPNQPLRTRILKCPWTLQPRPLSQERTLCRCPGRKESRLCWPAPTPEKSAMLLTSSTCHSRCSLGPDAPS